MEAHKKDIYIFTYGFQSGHNFCTYIWLCLY